MSLSFLFGENTKLWNAIYNLQKWITKLDKIWERAMKITVVLLIQNSKRLIHERLYLNNYKKRKFIINMTKFRWIINNESQIWLVLIYFSGINAFELLLYEKNKTTQTLSQLLKPNSWWSSKYSIRILRRNENENKK